MRECARLLHDASHFGIHPAKIRQMMNAGQPRKALPWSANPCPLRSPTSSRSARHSCTASYGSLGRFPTRRSVTTAPYSPCFKKRTLSRCTGSTPGYSAFSPLRRCLCTRIIFLLAADHSVANCEFDHGLWPKCRRTRRLVRHTSYH